MKFHDITIMAAGEKRSQRLHDTTAIEPKARDLLAEWLQSHEADFTAPIPHDCASHLTAHVSRIGTTALFTIFDTENRPLTTSILLPGDNPAEETNLLRQMQRMIFRIDESHGVEPAHDLLLIKQRPALVTIVIGFGAKVEDLKLVADIETCIAAAWFELHEEIQ